MSSVDALIVDSHDACMAMNMAMQPLTSVFATHKREALELARKHEPRFLVVEQIIGGHDIGIAVLDALVEALPRAHGVLLSACRERSTDEAARRHGHALLRKPFGQWALQDVINKNSEDPVSFRPLRTNPVRLDLGGTKFPMGPRTFAIAQLRGPYLWEGLEPAVMREFLDSLTTEDVSDSLGLVSSNAARAHLRRATQKAREFHALDSLGPRALRLEILRMILEPG